jgi:hypothetical protein
MGLRLYEISSELRALADAADGGELTPEQVAAIDALTLSL